MIVIFFRFRMLSLLRRNYEKWKVFPPKDLIKTLSKIQITETSIFWYESKMPFICLTLTNTGTTYFYFDYI